MRELQDQLEAEQYFSTLYKTQVNELKEEVDEKTKQVQHQRIRLKKKNKQKKHQTPNDDLIWAQMSEMEEEGQGLAHQLQLSLARADSEALARAIAEETVAELEKEKTMKELEIKDIVARHRADLINKEVALHGLRERETELKKTHDLLAKVFHIDQVTSV